MRLPDKNVEMDVWHLLPCRLTIRLPDIKILLV
jgi:hypothetical protein